MRPPAQTPKFIYGATTADCLQTSGPSCHLLIQITGQN